MGISEATKKKLEDNLNKALEKETPESCNKFLDEQLEKECSRYFEDNDDLCVHEDYIKFAKHFFELGMSVSNKAQKGE